MPKSSSAIWTPLARSVFNCSSVRAVGFQQGRFGQFQRQRGLGQTGIGQGCGHGVDQVRPADLTGRHVHRHEQVEIQAASQFGQRLARLAQHPATHRHDQAALLGDRDEVFG